MADHIRERGFNVREFGLTVSFTGKLLGKGPSNLSSFFELALGLVDSVERVGRSLAGASSRA
jgi:hypothetical protein